jgi:uncharacterized protein (TIGR02266 family)
MTANFYIDDNQNSGQEPPPGEKRCQVRFPVCLAVQYGKQSPIEYNSFILNMSVGGIYIRTDEPFPVGTEITIRLFIPPQIKLLVELTGKVAWVNKEGSSLPPGMGIKFDEHNKEALRKLAAFVEEDLQLIDRQV